MLRILFTGIFSSLILFSSKVQGATVEEGKYFKFTCIKDGQAMTVDSEVFTTGANIIASPWKRMDSQKWLTLKEGENYIILPARQHKLFASFLATRKQSGSPTTLPSVTVALGIDNSNGAIIQQIYNGKSNQHWQFVDAKQGRILIKSPLRGKCISEKQPEKVELSFLQKASMKIKDTFTSKKENSPTQPISLKAEDCDDTDSSQVWLLEQST